MCSNHNGRVRYGRTPVCQITSDYCPNMQLPACHVVESTRVEQFCLRATLGYPRQQQLFHQFDTTFIVESAKHQHAFQYFTDTKYSTLKFYRILQPVYRYADYLSTIRCASNRRLISRFRTGCHGLQIDTDRWV